MSHDKETPMDLLCGYPSYMGWVARSKHTLNRFPHSGDCNRTGKYVILDWMVMRGLSKASCKSRQSHQVYFEIIKYNCCHDCKEVSLVRGCQNWSQSRWRVCSAFTGVLPVPGPQNPKLSTYLKKFCKDPMCNPLLEQIHTKDFQWDQ